MKIGSLVALLSCLLWPRVSLAATGDHETAASLGLNSSTVVDGRLFTNIPLPLLYLKKGDYKFTVQPAYVSGSLSGTNSNFLDPGAGGVSGDATAGGTFTGWGGAASASYSFADRWGIFGVAEGNTISGNFSLASVGGAQRLDNLGSKTSYVAFGIGVTYQFFGETDGGFVLPVFLGPSLTYLRTSTRVVATGNGLGEDYDLTATKAMPGFVLGAQAGINVSKSWLVNPFIVIIPPLGNNNPAPRIGTVRVDNGFSGNSLENFRSGSVMSNSYGDIGIGVNLTYRPWGLTANLTSPFLSKVILFKHGVSKNVNSSTVAISWSFGKYRK